MQHQITVIQQNYEYSRIRRTLKPEKTTTNPLLVVDRLNPLKNPLLKQQQMRKVEKEPDQQIYEENYFETKEIMDQKMNDYVSNKFIQENQREFYNRRQKEYLAKIQKKDYLDQIDSLYNQMLKSWENQDKVQALQIIIKCIKLLNNEEDIKFQILKFQKINKIILDFCSLVYDRIIKLQYGSLNIQKITQFKFDDSTLEIIQNWLMKVGSIREIIPRIFLQTGFLQINTLLNNSQDKMNKMIQQLASQSKCIGKKLTSIYYLYFMIQVVVKVGNRIDQQLAYFNIYKQAFEIINSQNPKTELDSEDNSYLIQPFFNFYFDSINQVQDPSLYDEIFDLLKTSNSISFIILLNFIQKVEIQFIHNNLIQILGLVSQQDESNIKVYIAFLQRIQDIQLSFNQKEYIFNQIYKVLDKSDEFILQLKMIIQMVLSIGRNGKDKNQKKVLWDQLFIEKLYEFFKQIDYLEDQQQQQMYEDISSFIYQIMQNSESQYEIQILEPFIQIIQLFPANFQKECSQRIISTFFDNQNLTNISDPQIINQIMSLLQFINQDNPNKNELLELVQKSYQKMNFGLDIESKLNTITELRKNFIQNELVIEYLINQVINTIIEIHHISKGRINSKLLNFIKGCIAFCHISVPSLKRPLKEIEIYIQVAQIALQYDLVIQSESILKSSVKMIPFIQFSNQNEVRFFINVVINSLLHTLILFPDNPEKDSQELMRATQNVLEDLELIWFQDIYKIIIKFKIVIYYCIQLQQQLPLSLQNLQSNDQLYKDKAFHDNISEMINELINQIHQQTQDIQLDNSIDLMLIHQLLAAIYQVQQYLQNNQQIIQIKKNVIQSILFMISSKLFNQLHKKTLEQKIKHLMQIERNQDVEAYKVIKSELQY